MQVAPFAVVRTEDSVVTVKQTVTGPGWEQWYLLMADAHWDNPHCRRDLLKRDLDLARERSAGIIDLGDWFCAMQGKYDPRHQKADVRPEHLGDNYLDLLVDTGADYLRPYADLLVARGEGNHEWTIRKRLETDIHGRLCRALGAQMMREWGFIRFQFDASSCGGGRSRQNLYFHHGYGGGAPVTKGTIQQERTDAMVFDADIFASGHIHQRVLTNPVTIGLNHNGRVVKRERVHLICSTYKDEFGMTGYHTQQGRRPRPMGGWWLRFYYDRSEPGCVGRREVRA